MENVVQEQVGDFRLQGVEKFRERAHLGAREALSATYEGPEGTLLTNNPLDMPSPEEADELRRQRVQEQQEELELRIAGEQPVKNEAEKEIGTVTVLVRQAAGSAVTAVSWTNKDWHGEATSEGSEAETFFQDLPGSGLLANPREPRPEAAPNRGKAYERTAWPSTLSFRTLAALAPCRPFRENGS